MTDATIKHRVLEICWLPKTTNEWISFTAARTEAGQLWNTIVKLHARIRRLKWKWPSFSRWCKWAKGKFPNLSAQSTQQVIKEFCNALTATTAARKMQKTTGQTTDLTKYPWKSKRYRNVPYTNQGATIKNGILRLPHGKRGNKPLNIKLPKNLQLPGRLISVQLAYGVVRIVCELPIPTDTKPLGPIVGVDLGVNTLISATDGTKAVLISGREAKSIVRYRNKANAELRSRIDRAKQGSRRQKKLVRARHKMTDKSARKIKDLLHKATRIVANQFPNSPVIVGKPFNDAARKLGRVQAQQVSQASNARLIAMLAYKMAGTTEVNEAYSSQTCPVCGCRNKCRRVYKCQSCGFTAPRDVVGALNIRMIGLVGCLRPDLGLMAPVVKWRHPSKYPGCKPGRSGGTPALVAF